MGGRGHDVGMRDRIEVTSEHLSGHQSGEVGHVDHERGPNVVGDLGQVGEIRVPWVGRVPRYEHKWTELSGLGGDGVVIEEPGGGIDPVTGLIE